MTLTDTSLIYSIRPAGPDDADALAELGNFAGDGLPLYVWESLAAPGEDAWKIGRARARRGEGSFSWREARVAEVEGEVAACLIGHAIPAQPGPVNPDTPAMFVPLQELENLAPGTWYVNALAAYPRFRGQGLGTRLLAIAEAQARRSGCRTTSLIVSDANPGARRLYERCGYTERARRPMVKEGWINPGRNWVLMVR